LLQKSLFMTQLLEFSYSNCTEKLFVFSGLLNRVSME